jgi:hypothetical protein
LITLATAMLNLLKLKWINLERYKGLQTCAPIRHTKS